MNSASSGPSSTQVRTIDDGTRHSSSSDLTAISDEPHTAGSKLLTKARASLGKTELPAKAKKRPRGDTQSERVNVKKAKVKGEESEKGIYCHQCRTRCEPEEVLRCTNLKLCSKNRPPRACHLAWCDKDLARRYAVDAKAVRMIGSSENVEEMRHAAEPLYTFTCPCCRDECQNSTCRKKKGLKPLGNVVRAMRRGSGNPSEQTVPRAAAHRIYDSSSFVNLDGESSLSDIENDDPVDTPSTEFARAARPKIERLLAATTNTAKAANTHAPVSKTLKPTQKPLGSGGKAKGTGMDKAVKLRGIEKGKGKQKQGTEKEGAKKPRPKKPEVVVEPPDFEKVDTRLDCEEASQRIQLREYLFRFRSTLSIPERSLSALDDFDRPLTEASVRLFGGAMLDMVKDELESADDDSGLRDIIFEQREELRYYADLARFTSIFTSLAPSLSLRLPAAIPSRDSAAVRAILNPGDRELNPTWALDTAGPSRRVGASRIPQPAEVIRMLLALAERTFVTRKIRADLDCTSGEYEERRSHATESKKQYTIWESKKKGLMEARVKCKTAADTKANKNLIAIEEHEHDLRIRFLNVNLRAVLSRRALRYGILGIDLDGRTYFVLSPRVIEENGRPPAGWASGLLAWGVGIPSSRANEEDALPAAIDRWSHFGKSQTVNHLIKWIEYRYKKAVAAARPANSRPPKISGSITAKSAQTTTPSKITHYLKPTPFAQKASIEVVIPISARRAGRPSLPNGSSAPLSKTMLSDDMTSLSSDLSAPPEAFSKDLLASLPNRDYKSNVGTIEEEGRQLTLRLKEVSDWLEVLEWKGMGEVE